MAVPISVADAAVALQTHFGARLEADYEDGRGELADALRQHFSLSRGEARQLVEQLESARTIRWRPGAGPDATLGDASNALGGMAAGTGISGTASPGALGGGLAEHLIPMHSGSYWQLDPTE
jgi:hypothetical protein